MKMRLLPITLLCSSVCAQSYDTLTNYYEVDSQNNAVLHLTKMNGEEPICMAVNFDITASYAQVWLDMIKTSTVTHRHLSFTFDDETCQLTQLALTPIFDDAGNGGLPSGPLQETGLYGNVALIGTNNITEANITSSDHYRNDTPQGAFDGYVFTEQFNEDSQGQINRGMWLTPSKDENGKKQYPWVEVDFGMAVEIAGAGFFINPRSLELGRLPRNVTLMISQDGVDYEEAFTGTLAKAENNVMSFPSKVTAQYFRLSFNGNFGDKTFLELDEIELYQ